MKHIFRDIEQDRLFHRQGYLLEPVLNNKTLAELKAFYDSEIDHSGPDLHFTAFSRDIEYRRHIYEKIVQTFQTGLRAVLPGYKMVMGIFVTKRPHGKKSRLGLHQDNSMVDHALHTGINIWCPLSDVDQRNGCMKVIPGSHAFNHICATPPNPAPYDPYRQVLESEYMKALPMVAGSALIFDTRLLHATDQNMTGMRRGAVLINMVPLDVAPRFYFWNSGKPDYLSAFEIDAEFLLKFEPNTYMPDPESYGARFIKTMDYPVKPLNLKDYPLKRCFADR